MSRIVKVRVDYHCLGKLSHSSNERWAPEGGLFCPGCGQPSVWANQGGGDYYVGVEHLCLACKRTFYLPDGVNGPDEYDEQRLAQIGASLPKPTRRRPMYKFREKPVVIEAFQMTEGRRADNRDWPEWLNCAWQIEPASPGAVFPTEPGTSSGTISIRTLEGDMLVNFGDWIIQGVHGELYPCKPDIFAATYDAVEEDSNA